MRNILFVATVVSLVACGGKEVAKTDSTTTATPAAGGAPVGDTVQVKADSGEHKPVEAAK